jgi:hypothetical protein
VVNMTLFHNIQKSWPFGDIEPTIINPLVLQLGQGVFLDGLSIFLFYLVDKLKLTPKIQEVMKFER